MRCSLIAILCVEVRIVRWLTPTNPSPRSMRVMLDFGWLVDFCNKYVSSLWLMLSQKNSYTYCKNLEVIKKSSIMRMLLGEGLVGVNHRTIPTSTQRMTIKEIPHASNLLHNGYHTCMLWDSQTSTQVFLKFTITPLEWL